MRRPRTPLPAPRPLRATRATWWSSRTSVREAVQRQGVCVTGVELGTVETVPLQALQQIPAGGIRGHSAPVDRARSKDPGGVRSPGVTNRADLDHLGHEPLPTPPTRVIVV